LATAHRRTTIAAMFHRPPAGLTALLALLVVGCGGVRGQWEDPGARLVDGTWIGPNVGCPPARAECRAIEDAARAAVWTPDGPPIAGVAWVDLPRHFVTDTGERRTPRGRVGILTLTAALVTFADHSQRVVGLSCHFPYDSDGRLGVVPTHVVDSTRALVLGLGLSKLQPKRGLSWDILDRG
jgi:hypothetical protein